MIMFLFACVISHISILGSKDSFPCFELYCSSLIDILYMECTCLCGCVRVPGIVHVCPYLWRSGIDTRHFFSVILYLIF